METLTLETLIATPKKSEASKAKKQLYNKLMLNMFLEQGVTDTTIQYLKSGFSFSGAKPLAMYYQNVQKEERPEILKTIINSELFTSKDKANPFKFGISLSAYAIEWFGDDYDLFSEIVKILPKSSKNKKGETLKDAPKILEKYFLEVIGDKTALPIIDKLGLSENYINDYREMMKSILDDVAPKAKIKALRFYEWLTDDHIKEDTTKGTGSKPSADTTDNLPQKEATSDKEKADKALSKKELNDIVALFEALPTRLMSTIREWDKLRHRLEATQAELSKSLELIGKREDTIAYNQTIIAQSKEEIEKSRATISELRLKVREMSSSIAEKDSQIEEYKTELARLNSIISVYGADKQNAQSELLNSIASKLKSEYRDFKDVKNEEMTLDLGENFRFQLQSVFRALIKSGIDVEKR